MRTFFSNSNPVALRFEMSGKIDAVRKKLSDIAMDNKDFKLKVIPIEKHDASIEREVDTVMIQTTGDQHVHVPALGLSACTKIAREKID